VRRPLVLLALATSSLVLIIAPGAAAADTACMGALTGTHDNVVVPPGQSCFVSGATVRGNVKALQDSRLRITGSNVHGNVEGEKADIVQVTGSTVGGNITVKEGGPPVAVAPGFTGCQSAVAILTPCEVFITTTRVEHGNIQVEKMHGTTWITDTVALSPIRGNVKVEDNLIEPLAEFIFVSRNEVEQNVQVFKNKGPGRKRVSENVVHQSVQCFENDPPFIGGPNVARDAQGQCAATPLPMALGAGLAPFAVAFG
jgi:hypothetical protein